MKKVDKPWKLPNGNGPALVYIVPDRFNYLIWRTPLWFWSDQPIKENENENVF